MGQSHGDGLLTPWIWCPRCGQQNPAPKGGTALRCRRCRRRFAVLAHGRSSCAVTKAPYQLGRFEVRERVGAGVFGTVYRAYDPQLQREVALQVSRAGVLADEERRQGFLGAASAARLMDLSIALLQSERAAIRELAAAYAGQQTGRTRERRNHETSARRSCPKS